MPITYPNENGKCDSCNKTPKKYYYLDQCYYCESCYEKLYGEIIPKMPKKSEKIETATTTVQNVQNVQITKAKDKASYSLVAIQLTSKGYTEIEMFTGKKSRKIVEWSHKDKKRLPVFITVFEGACKDEDVVVGLSVGINYPERIHVKEFMEKL